MYAQIAVKEIYFSLNQTESLLKYEFVQLEKEIQNILI